MNSKNLDEKITDELRSRFRRWLGQKVREDRHEWTTLLGSNYQGWRHNAAKKP